MADKPWVVGLTIGHGGKGIPYGGNGEPREDGTANHGFKNLKGNLHLLSQVPELEGDPALYALVSVINRIDNGLVSVGCGSWPESDEHGHHWRGYVEFAINSAEAIEDASSYFPLFFKFDKMLHGSGFQERVNFHWEIEGASFWPAGADGCTCTVWVHIPHSPTFEQSQDSWEKALKPLTYFLGGYPPQPGIPLFTPETDAHVK